MQEFTPFAQLAMSATCAVSGAGRFSRFLREAQHYAEKWADTTGSACSVARDGTTSWQSWDEWVFVTIEEPKESTPPKYDPGGARQMWQPGYPRILMRGEKNPVLMPRYNQVQHTARPLHGRKGKR